MAPPTTIFPVAEREICVVREAVAATVPAGAPGVVVPLTSFVSHDKPMWLDDTSWQGNMGDIQGRYQGPLIGALEFGGDVFDDTIGHFLWNLLGDYTVSGTAASPASTTTAPVAAGGTTLTVASGGASFTAGMNLWLEDAGTPAANEVVQVVSSTATTITITPTRFAHLTALPFTNTTGPYTHVFALLNGTTGAVNGSGQGPTHTITDINGIGTGRAYQFPYSCVQEIVLTGNAEKLTAWTCKTINQTRTQPGTPENPFSPSPVPPVPAWRTLMGVGGPASGGTLLPELGEFAVTITRKKMKAYNTLRGSQLPYIIARGELGCTGKFTVAPAIDESFYLAMIGNTQPQVQYVCSNGLSGTNLASIQADIGLASYDTADLADGDPLFGYEIPFTCVSTAASFGTGPAVTMTGASGAKGPVKITLQNNVASY